MNRKAKGKLRLTKRQLILLWALALAALVLVALAMFFDLRS